MLQPLQRARRLTVAVVAASLLVSACTASSDATPATTTDPDGPATTLTTAPPFTVFDPDFGEVVSKNDFPDEVQVATPGEIISTDGSKLVAIDSRTGDSHTLLTVGPLDVGADPGAGERFGRLDVGADRVVVFESRSGSEVSRVNVLTASRERLDVGEGSHPTIRPDGSAFAYLGPRGITVMWSATSRLASGFEIDGSVSSMRFSPSGATLAIAWDHESRNGLTLLDIGPNGFLASREVTPTPGRRFGLPSWIDDARLTVVDTATALDGPANLVTLDVADGSIVESIRLEDDVIDVDHSAGGASVLVVTTTGELKWIAGGATGNQNDSFSLGARW